MRGCPVNGCGGDSCLIDDCNPSPSAIDSGDIVWMDDFGDCAEIAAEPSERVICACGSSFPDQGLMEAHWDECFGRRS